jgi:hypothetical protein
LSFAQKVEIHIAYGALTATESNKISLGSQLHQSEEEAGDSLIMEAEGVSKTLYTVSIFTWLITEENFIAIY